MLKREPTKLGMFEIHFAQTLKWHNSIQQYIIAVGLQSWANGKPYAEKEGIKQIGGRTPNRIPGKTMVPFGAKLGFNPSPYRANIDYSSHHIYLYNIYISIIYIYIYLSIYNIYMQSIHWYANIHIYIHTYIYIYIINIYINLHHISSQYTSPIWRTHHFTPLPLRHG